MSFFSSIILNFILLLVPILLYFILEIYILNKKYDKYYFLVMVFLIYFLLFFYADISFINLSIFIFIPLILSYLSNNNHTSIIISIFLIFINYYFFNLNIYFLILEYVLYFIVNIKLSKGKYSLIKALIVVRTFFLSFYLFSNYLENSFNDNIIYLIMSIAISYLVSYFFCYMNYNSITLKEVNYLKKKNNRENYSANYLSAVLREVKDSLTISRGYLDMINIKNKKYNDYLKKVKNELTHSIDMIKDGDNLNNNEYQYEIIDVNVLIEEVIEEIKYSYDRKKIKYFVKYLDDDIFILGDFDKLKNVIVDLLQKKDRDTKVNIDMYLSNNRIVISIKDNSKIKKENIKKMDLISIKKVINNHHGEIIYENIFDEGIEISIVLPLITG